MARFGALPPPPRLPAEEITPVSSGVTVGTGKGKVRIATATIVAVVAAVAAAYGGRATAATDTSPGIQEDLRELRKDIRYIRVRVDRIEDRLEKAAPRED